MDKCYRHMYLHSDIFSLVRSFSVLCKGIIFYFLETLSQVCAHYILRKFLFEFSHLFVKSNFLKYMISKHFHRARIYYQIHILTVEDIVSPFLVSR